MRIVEKFYNLICNSSYTNEKYINKIAPLTNITFFLGAGFSKAWDNDSPLSKDLFSFYPIDYFETCNAVYTYVSDKGYDTHKPLNLNNFTELYYQVLMMDKYEFLQGKYYDQFNIKEIEKELRYIVYQEFKKKIDLPYINDTNNIVSKKCTAEKKEIFEFFEFVTRQLTGDYYHIPQGIRTNFITTNYDYICEEILDNLSEDSHYLYTYRGFTADKINKENNITYLHEESLVFRLIKLNGGFEIFKNEKGFEINHLKLSNDFLRENPPILILPSKEQNYENLYFNTVFKKAARCMQETDILVVVGYGFPEEDSIISLLINHFAESKRDMINKHLFYIDISKEESMKEKIHRVFHYEYPESKWFCSLYSGSFVDFCKEFNQLHKDYLASLPNR